MKNKIATIIGGSGYVGGYIAKELAKHGYLIQIVSRDPAKSDYMKTIGQVGQVHLKPADVQDTHAIKEIIQTSDVVINLVGILFESGKQRFYKAHTDAPRKVAKLCKELGIKTFINFSALGVDKAVCSNYAKSKYEGEKEAMRANHSSIILRPSVIVGPNDHFITMFRKYLKYSPVLPLVGEGKALFQPVYVGDIAKAILAIVKEPESYYGEIIELGGTKQYSFKNILEKIRDKIDSTCTIFPVPEKIYMIAAYFFEFLPKPPLTCDQIRLLRYNNVISSSSHHMKFADLHITPKSLEEIL